MRPRGESLRALTRKPGDARLRVRRAENRGDFRAGTRAPRMPFRQLPPPHDFSPIPAARSRPQIHEEFAASLPAGTPIFWLGLSMGGGVVTRAAQLRPPSASPLEGLVLLAPMISLTKVRQEYFFKPLGLRNQHLYGVMHQLSVRRAREPLHTAAALPTRWESITSCALRDTSLIVAPWRVDHTGALPDAPARQARH